MNRELEKINSGLNRLERWVFLVVLWYFVVVLNDGSITSYKIASSAASKVRREVEEWLAKDSTITSGG